MGSDHLPSPSTIQSSRPARRIAEATVSAAKSMAPCAGALLVSCVPWGSSGKLVLLVPAPAALRVSLPSLAPLLALGLAASLEWLGMTGLL
jgi:hypothetical protein